MHYWPFRELEFDHEIYRVLKQMGTILSLICTRTGSGGLLLFLLSVLSMLILYIGHRIWQKFLIFYTPCFTQNGILHDKTYPLLLRKTTMVRWFWNEHFHLHTQIIYRERNLLLQSVLCSFDEILYKRNRNPVVLLCQVVPLEKILGISVKALDFTILYLISF